MSLKHRVILRGYAFMVYAAAIVAILAMLR